jgi:hypothetical protein
LDELSWRWTFSGLHPQRSVAAAAEACGEETTPRG